MFFDILFVCVNCLACFKPF